MATGGVAGIVKVGYSANSPVSWTSIPQILDIKFPTWVSDQIDTTIHSTAKFKRSIPGMIAVSDMTLTLEWDPDETTTASHDALFDMNQAGTTYWWRIEVAANREATKWTPFEFQGYVKSWEPSTPINDKDTLQVVVSFDGDSFTKYAATESDVLS